MPIIVYLEADSDEHYDFFRRAVHTVSNHCILHFTSCGEDCYDLLETISPQFMFIALGEDAVDTLQVIRAIRSRPHLSELPVVVYSSYMEHVDATYAAGATYFLQKHDSYEETVQTLEYLLSPSITTARPASKHAFYIN